MRIAVTGGTGFIGRYILKALHAADHELVAWRRESSQTDGLQSLDVNWIQGSLRDDLSMSELVTDCQAVVHAALWKPGSTFRGGEGNLAEFAEVNVLGTLKLIQAAIEAGVKRFVFLSTCAVHERILEDRPLDEAHPLWPLTHYGAHKAAIEKFVHSYGFGMGYPICALRPTGVYGAAHPLKNSKWYSLVQSVSQGEPVTARGGGKEVHAADVAKAVEILLSAPEIAGQAFSCYDRYVSQLEVAQIAKKLSGSAAEIEGQAPTPKHQIKTDKLRALGMQFGGRALLEQTIAEMIGQ